MSGPVWDGRLLPRARAEAMAGDWPTYEETHLRCGHSAFSRDDAQRGERTCGQSMGVVTPQTTKDQRLAMILRHMVMAHDHKLSGGTGGR